MKPGPVEAASTLVVKVGSSLVTNEGRGLDVQAIARWAAQVASLQQGGKRCILVSSGAIAAGMQRLGWTRHLDERRPDHSVADPVAATKL